jgi:outer membrane protein assembly factor BamB
MSRGLSAGHAILLLLSLCGVPALSGDDVNWPSFRGARASGVSTGPDTPVEWNVESGENVRWKTAIPGLGLGAPVIWGDKVFVTTAVGPDENPRLKVGLYGEIKSAKDDEVHQWKVLCLDKETGKLLWERTAHEGKPAIRRHPKSSHANSTPATDGKHVVAFFGSEGLHCYDMDGKLIWKRDFGVLDSGFFMVPGAQWGFGSSPVIHDGRVIVQCDVQKGSFVAALDLKDGKLLWRTDRRDVPTWSSPMVLETEGRSQVVLNGYKHIGGYDLVTGKELWKMGGGGDIPVPTPVFGHGLIFVTSAHGPAAPVFAIRPDAVGDISLDSESTSNRYVAWSAARSASYMQTPIVYGDHLYVCRDNGVLSVFEAKTGRRLGQQRLGGGSTGFTASAVSAGGKLYYTSETGDVYVLRPGAEPEVLVKNELGEVCMATPAISDGTLFFRTKGHVIAIGKKP